MSEQIPAGEKAYFRVTEWTQDLSIYGGEPSRAVLDLEKQTLSIESESLDYYSVVKINIAQARTLQKFLNDMLQ